jgi:hypothetical protein
MPDDRSGEFSLVHGGPMCGLFCRLGLLKPPVDRLGRRIAALVLVAWVPLLVLSSAAGDLYGSAGVPFLKHLDAHVRFLGSLPLLLIAELIVQQRITIVVRQFVAQGLVPPEARPRFDEIVASSRRLVCRAAPEVILAAIALTLGIWLWQRHVALPVDTWYHHPTPEGMSLTPAGVWYAFVSLPLLRFILYRWYFRLAVWYRLLWKISRLPLNLNAAHPDQAAGLGFLGVSVVAFAPILVAHTVALSGLIGDQIWHRGLPLPSFKSEIGIVLALLLLLVLAPLFFFAFRISGARRAALREHAIFAGRYVEEFARKWIRPSDPPAPSPLGNQDIQSLADLGAYYQAVRETRVLPVGKRSILQVGLLMALPLLPLLLTMMPLEEVIARLARLVI